MSLFDTIKHGTLEAVAATRNEIKAIEADPGAAAKGAAVWAYDQLLGNDVNTLLSEKPDVTVADRVLAGISIASNFVGPEGKLLDKGLTTAAKFVLEHGGEKLGAIGLEKLEASIGKDAVKELSKSTAHAMEHFNAGIELTEKILDKFKVARELKNTVTTTLTDTKKTIEDVALAAQAPPANRAAAWAQVTKDLVRDGMDVSRLVTAVRDGRESLHPTEPALAKLQHDATGTFLQDAEKLKGANGRIFASGKDLVVDIRTSKDFTAATNAMLREMQAEARAGGKHMVTYAPNISDAQERKLLADGILVAKTPSDLTHISLASKVPGDVGVALLRLDQRVGASQIAEAVRERREENDTRETLAGVADRIARGPADVGVHHDNAKPWDGKQSTYGSISWARDGEVQQYNRGQWISYDAAKLAGDPPVEGHQVIIKADPQTGMAVVSDPLQHELAQGRGPAIDTAPSR